MLPFVVDEAANVSRVAFAKHETRLDVHPLLKGIVNEKGTTEFACRQSVPVASIAWEKDATDLCQVRPFPEETGKLISRSRSQFPIIQSVCSFQA